jgi:CO/xanthine dehydrogenase Mo-binding subunit
MPMIEPILVEVPNPAHPYGAKGVGEVNIAPPMAAIATAIDDAIHQRITEPSAMTLKTARATAETHG